MDERTDLPDGNVIRDIEAVLEPVREDALAVGIGYATDCDRELLEKRAIDILSREGCVVAHNRRELDQWSHRYFIVDVSMESGTYVVRKAYKEPVNKLPAEVEACVYDHPMPTVADFSRIRLGSSRLVARSGAIITADKFDSNEKLGLHVMGYCQEMKSEAILSCIGQVLRVRLLDIVEVRP